MADMEIIEDIEKGFEGIGKGKFKKFLPFIIGGAGLGVIALLMKGNTPSQENQLSTNDNIADSPSEFKYPSPSDELYYPDNTDYLNDYGLGGEVLGSTPVVTTSPTNTTVSPSVSPAIKPSTTTPEIITNISTVSQESVTQVRPISHAVSDMLTTVKPTSPNEVIGVSIVNPNTGTLKQPTIETRNTTSAPIITNDGVYTRSGHESANDVQIVSSNTPYVAPTKEQYQSVTDSMMDASHESTLSNTGFGKTIGTVTTTIDKNNNVNNAVVPNSTATRNVTTKQIVTTTGVYTRSGHESRE